MGGIGSPEALQRGLEAALRRDRLVVAVGLAGLIALAWLYLWRAASMHAAMGGMPMDALDPAGLALTFLMWAVMMAAMMLPGAAPTILVYATMARKHAERGSALPAVWVFVAGYLLVWAGFSIAATALQAVLEQAALLTPMMSSASRSLSGALLVAAGIYQLTPLKNVCLSKCRDPVRFFMTRWRPGTAGALRMGAAHGAYCVGCCAMLMLLLFAVGVMSLGWVALIAALILAEKLLPAGPLGSRFAGAVLIALGLGVLALAP